jgi:hypothetical protein
MIGGDWLKLGVASFGLLAQTAYQGGNHEVDLQERYFDIPVPADASLVLLTNLPSQAGHEPPWRDLLALRATTLANGQRASSPCMEA